jgi:hypothetical protein
MTYWVRQTPAAFGAGAIGGGSPANAAAAHISVPSTISTPEAELIPHGAVANRLSHP